MRAELILGCQNHHGEGIFWNPIDQRVWWTDIHGQHLHWYEPESGKHGSVSMPDRVCCFAPRKNGGLIVAFADRVSFFDFEKGETGKLCDFEPDNQDTRLNDGRTDRSGRLIAGGMNEATGAKNSSVISIDEHGNVQTIIENVSCANSTCFSPDGSTMYFADTPEKTIRAYSYDTKTGAIGDMYIHCNMSSEPGLPDGSCVDAEGGVWNAEWEGHRVVRIAPDGSIDRIVEIPVLKPTCCAFGGKDLDTLFITTSRLMSTDEQLEAEPDSGGLFAIKPGFRGLLDTAYAG